MARNALILGCGYVGSALAKHWQSSSDLEVTVTTTREERLAELGSLAKQAIVVAGHEEEAMRSQLKTAQTLILSLGAKRGDSYTDTYLKTAQTLQKALADNASVQQIIYTSSYGVYGDQQGNWVTEETPAQPANDNGKILLDTEQQLLTLATPARHVCVFRLGGIYGPGRELAHIFRFAEGKIRPGDGTSPGNWVHLEDIVGAIAFAAEHRLNGLYNLVDSNPTPSKQLLDWVCAQANLAPIQWDPSQPSQRGYNARVSNQKLRDAGYTFQHPSVITP